ncbi:hypothetical protein H8356DRAFT_1342518 [Neocallimastix lanati (nom. inval.)]|nr:hypothetical protein H8356DRAFT_1342518 [Neocallimastix sp. JGI-2020a]
MFTYLNMITCSHTPILYVPIYFSSSSSPLSLSLSTILRQRNHDERNSPQKEREINLTFNIEKGRKGKSFTPPP